MNKKFKFQFKFYDYIEKSIINNKKISHAYLIEVSNLSNYMEYIKDFVKILLCIKYESNENIKNKICYQVDDNCYPDLKIIQPEGIWIKKEQLLKLESDFSKKSMLDNKLIYIIDKAEDLNDSSANTILKFLEEPQDNIVAILLTSNRYRVLDTIISRCQILNLLNEDEEEKIESNLMNFIEDINSNKKLILSYDLYINNLFFDKESSITNLNILEKYFCKCLDQNNISNTKENLLKNMSNEKILQYIDRFNIFKEKLQYNVNLKLWLTNFLIKLMEVN